MTEGTFIEGSDDLHMHLRSRLLQNNAQLPRLPATNGHEDTAAVLRDTGWLLVDGKHPLDNDEFLALGAELGEAVPETHATVQPYVDQEVILNLVSMSTPTRDAELQPFATNALTLHSESSGRPVAQQPRFIVLMCCEPGDDSASAQTVVVPMDRVAARLSGDEQAILARTRYRGNPEGPPILRDVDGRAVFSFRDFGDQELHWTYEGDDGGADANQAIRSLLQAMYAPDNAFAVQWRRGDLVVIDNTFVFHGRTAGTGAQPGRRRHLKRLRIRAPADGVDRAR